MNDEHLYARITKDINEYEEKVFFTLTQKQVKFLIYAIAVGAVMIFIATTILKLEFKLWLYPTIIVCTGILLLGFVTHKGYPLDKYIMLGFKYHNRKNKLFNDNERVIVKKREKNRKLDKTMIKADKRLKEWEG